MQVDVQTTTVKTLKINGQQIKKWLEGDGYLHNDDKISITFNVPSGGDWSGMNIDIDDENYITAIITSTNN